MLFGTFEEIHTTYILSVFAGLYLGVTLCVCGKLFERYKSSSEAE